MAWEINQKKTSSFYGVPVMTISDHVHGKKLGPLPVISPTLEAEFAKKLKDLTDRGFGLTKQLVLQKAAKLCRLAQLPHPFKEGPAASIQRKLHLTASGPGKPKRPQVLLLDQHDSHEVYELILVARGEQGDICSSLCGGLGTFNDTKERSNSFRVTGICPFSPCCLPEMAFATCFQEVSVAISVPAPTELDASGELQPCGSDEPLPCGSDDPQPSGSGQIEPVELMVVDSSEVSGLPCHLQESGPDKPEAWFDQVFQLGETRPPAPVCVHRVLTSEECIQNKKEELEQKAARDANTNKKRQLGESGKGKGKINMGGGGLCYIYVVLHRVEIGYNVTHVNCGCIRNVYLKI
ncbi:hypothetical protein LSH36_243g03011 [Paralvinella palmiformis]|uniref:Uncharacterized protein n=1 Tax=Paralvinella palmiformis TaxID=53620 RepID=A0AAD9JM92_9ANNE|nr:hypothetical protein LSH36_243g03011 [Paralvinella palmiformis]